MLEVDGAELAEEGGSPAAGQHPLVRQRLVGRGTGRDVGLNEKVNNPEPRIVFLHERLSSVRHGLRVGRLSCQWGLQTSNFGMFVFGSMNTIRPMHSAHTALLSSTAEAARTLSQIGVENSLRSVKASAACCKTSLMDWRSRH